MKNKKKKIVLLDAHAIIHRAYHALPGFSTKDGDPTGALFGVCTMLFKIIKDFNPDSIIACYDLPEKTFRHEAYEAYKGGRGKTDDELVFQLEESRSIFEAFDIPIYDMVGFEADDILGTIVEETLGDKNIEIVIASGDMDTMQLISGDKVVVYTLKKGIKDTVIYNEDAMRKRFGFGPELLPDYKGLSGDPSDNIIGVPGIGDKTATTLISNFGTVEKILDLAKNNPDKLKEAGVKDRIIGLLVEHEEEALFSKTLATIRRDVPIDFVVPEKHWKEGVDMVQVTELLEKFEFRSLLSRVHEILNIEIPDEDIVSAEDLGEEDTLFFEKAQIALWLLDSDKTNPSLDDIFFFTKKKNINEALKVLEKSITEQDLDFVYKEIELPIMSVIKNMEKAGISMDTKALKKLSKKYHKELEGLESKIYKLAGMEFNIKSPKQLGEVLFEKMDLPTKGIKKNASGGYSTRADQLEKLSEHEIISFLLRYRELQKVLSTYIDALPGYVGDDGRIHAEFDQAGTTTGRFSSNNPNMQNIPASDVLGKEIRKSFIASKDSYLVSYDYSQVEIRVAAILSQDEKLLEIFQKGEDVHSGVAMHVFGVKSEDVTKDQRRRAKVINFGIIYGMGVLSLKKSLGGTKQEAEEFMSNYFNQFPAVKSYLEEVKEFARENGYTETLFGRKRFFPSIKSKIPFIRAMAERMAVNAPIQGTATADIVKLAMRNVDERIKKEGWEESVVMIMQVHDELVFEIKKEILPEVALVIRDTMEKSLPEKFLKGRKGIPLVVDILYGDDWGTLASYKS
jgi:DNA polymerase-1